MYLTKTKLQAVKRVVISPGIGDADPRTELMTPPGIQIMRCLSTVGLFDLQPAVRCGIGMARVVRSS